MAPQQTSRTVTEHSADLVWSVTVLLRALHAAINEAVGGIPHGPRGYQILTTVIHDQPPSQLGLAEHLGIDRTVMTYLIDDLEQAGLVDRQPNPADRRQRTIVATEQGRRTLAELEHRVRQAEDDVLATLDPADRDALRVLLRRLACAVTDVSITTDPCTLVEDVLGGSAS